MGRGGNGDVKGAAGACCCAIVTIASCIMLALSFSILSPDEYGIRYDGIKRVLYHDVYNNGRFFLGLGHEFIKYPRSMRYIEYSNSSEGGKSNKQIVCWSKDGQEVVLEIGLYYRVMREKLVDLYYKFETDFGTKVEKISRHAIRDTCTRFDTIQFFEERPAIQDSMKAEVNRRVIAHTYCTVPLFSLMSIDVPELFNTAVKRKIVMKQKRNTAMKRKVIRKTNAEIEVLNAEGYRNITIIRSRAQAEARVIVAKGEAQALRTILNTEGSAYSDLLASLFAGGDGAGLANSAAVAASQVASPEARKHLLQYIWTQLVRQAQGSKLILGFPHSARQS